MTITLYSDKACTDTSLEIAVQDDLLATANGACHLIDFARTTSYPLQATPTQGAVVNDLMDNAAGSIDLNSQTVNYNGRGLDFVNTAATGAVAIMPAGVLDTIWGSGSGLQHYLACIYLKLPSYADWTRDTKTLYFWSGSTTNQISGVPDLVSFLFDNITGSTDPGISVRRQLTGSSSSTRLQVTSAHRGLFAQVAYWRSVAGYTQLRLKTSAGTKYAIAVPGTANGPVNSTDFRTGVPRIGVCKPITNLTSNAAATNFRAYRAFIEDLDLSGRLPETVLDDDYARTIARGVFS